MSTTYTVCNECRVLNKFDAARSGNAICGRCKKPLPIHAGVTEATAAGLRRLVESSPVPVVIDFWAPWCGPCRSFAPTFERTASRRLGKSVFAKIKPEVEQGVGQTYGIRGIPTLVVFSEGKEIARQSGALDPNSLERWLSDVGA